MIAAQTQHHIHVLRCRALGQIVRGAGRTRAWASAASWSPLGKSALAHLYGVLIGSEDSNTLEAYLDKLNCDAGS